MTYLLSYECFIALKGSHFWFYIQFIFYKTHILPNYVRAQWGFECFFFQVTVQIHAELPLCLTILEFTLHDKVADLDGNKLILDITINGPRQANLVLIAYASSEGSGNLRIRAVSPEPSLLAHTSSESSGTFRQKARSLAPLNDWACAVKICHDGMLEDTNSFDGAQIIKG